MAISLFRHNEEAYRAALDMLSEVGKAAVIHPTGTGKSFIGFKLCEEFPDKTICWLSPSEYIFRTQLENLKNAADGWTPENVKFFTYARLMNLTKDEIGEIRPDFIVLDEFHRCGAEQWGQGVQNVLDAYPTVPVLGLSATAIRYLDNQRNMADELFDGNIASEMTLGEAIVRGILNPPTYVLSVYAYQQDYERIKSAVKQRRNKAVRDKAEKYLEALRRALELADGLDTIFDKHMKDRTGKYIVFCSDLEHMREMMGKVGEWFAKVDAKPHVYYAYSNDPATSQAFADFKADGSGHLKLLFTIDMLNEGIHVDDVSGVILFRPTVSPIIYKQQIGRALSASKTTEPVIFDIVNNIENLYSIGTIEQEMQVAMQYYRMNGEAASVVNERFKVIDEVGNARELFDALNDTLSAGWETMFRLAKEYYEKNGHLEVPRRYKTTGGYSLGNWIFTQRKVYAGEQYGQLDGERIKKLESIGMVWDSVRDLSWKRYYAAAEAYHEKHGNLNTDVNEVTEDGLRLGLWICRLRAYRKNGAKQAYLTQEHIAALDRLRMIWDIPDYLWEDNYHACMAYYREHGNLDIPVRYVSPEGLRIGNWIRKLRSIYNGRGGGAELSGEQIRRLEEIGMTWDNAQTAAWNRGFAAARQYFEEHGDLDVPVAYETKDGFRLGGWIADQRERGAAKLGERAARLDEIGMIWKRPDSWETRYALAKAYFDEHGDLNVPAQYKADGVWLNKWLNEQRQIYIGNRPGKALADEQIQRLEAIGMKWGDRNRQNRSGVREKQSGEAEERGKRTGRPKSSSRMDSAFAGS